MVAGVERLGREGDRADGVAAREAINVGQTIRPRPRPLGPPHCPAHAALQQSAALADHTAGPAVRKAHRVYAARIAAVDQPLPPGN